MDLMVAYGHYFNGLARGISLVFIQSSGRSITELVEGVKKDLDVINRDVIKEKERKEAEKAKKDKDILHTD